MWKQQASDGMTSATTGGFQLWMARRAERLDNRAAVRLVRAEIVHARAMIEGAATNPKACAVVVPPQLQKPRLGR
jgi:hypothetical protein